MEQSSLLSYHTSAKRAAISSQGNESAHSMQAGQHCAKYIGGARCVTTVRPFYSSEVHTELAWSICTLFRSMSSPRISETISNSKSPETIPPYNQFPIHSKTCLSASSKQLLSPSSSGFPLTANPCRPGSYLRCSISGTLFPLVLSSS